MNREERAEQLMPYMLGNKSAVEFIILLVEALHVWDDLIDHDKAVDDMSINDAFYSLLITIPNNVFYRENFSKLNPIIANAITNWHIANRMERKGDEYQKRIAYILRSTYVDVITQSATIIGGVEHGVYVGFQNRLFTHKETLEGYLANLEVEQAARASFNQE